MTNHSNKYLWLDGNIQIIKKSVFVVDNKTGKVVFVKSKSLERKV